MLYYSIKVGPTLECCVVAEAVLRLGHADGQLVKAHGSEALRAAQQWQQQGRLEAQPQAGVWSLGLLGLAPPAIHGSAEGLLKNRHDISVLSRCNSTRCAAHDVHRVISMALEPRQKRACSRRTPNMLPEPFWRHNSDKSTQEGLQN
jgi:hypothetical protein